MREEEMRRRRRRRDYDDQAEEEEEEDERVLEWEDGLPSADDLTPLSQHLIPPQLASAFSIKPEPLSTMLDVHRATHKTLSTLLLRSSSSISSKGSLPFPTTTKTNNPIIKPPSSTFFNELADVNQTHEEEEDEEDQMVVEGDEDDPPPGTPPSTKDKDGLETTRKIRRRRRRRTPGGVLLQEEEEENNNANITEEEEEEEEADSNDDHSSAARTMKRPRLVWTPQLHKRFVDVVAHLGIKNAVPKTIMQLMNVQGLTRENVASHLQKYRLYLKRMKGLSNEGPSSSDPLFASTPPVPHTLHEPPAGKQHISHPQPPPPPPMPYGGNMLPMPVLGHCFGNPAGAAAAAYQGFEFHSYGMFRDQRREYWSGNRFGPMVSYPKTSK